MPERGGLGLHQCKAPAYRAHCVGDTSIHARLGEPLFASVERPVHDRRDVGGANYAAKAYEIVPVTRLVHPIRLSDQRDA